MMSGTSSAASSAACAAHLSTPIFRNAAPAARWVVRADAQKQGVCQLTGVALCVSARGASGGAGRGRS